MVHIQSTFSSKSAVSLENYTIQVYRNIPQGKWTDNESTKLYQVFPVHCVKRVKKKEELRQQ